MLWIFGYGALVHTTPFPFIRSEVATLKGFTRRFWQGSRDLRGTSEAPGRVATLREESEGHCMGRAFEIADVDHNRVLSELDSQEGNGGYDRRLVTLHVHGKEVIEDAVTYIAGEGNPSWMGPATMPELVRQIVGAHGTNGTNLAYVMDLADALRALEARDAHLFELADQLRNHGSPPS